MGVLGLDWSVSVRRSLTSVRHSMRIELNIYIYVYIILFSRIDLISRAIAMRNNNYLSLINLK